MRAKLQIQTECTESDLLMQLLEEVVYADGNSVKLSYNPLKQLTEIKDWLGVTSIDVDELGRAKKVTDHNGNEVEYTFGTGGERTSITYPDGKVAEYQYDEALRLKTLIDGENRVEYSYDANSRLSDKVFSSGVSTKYSYNEMGMLSELVHSDRDGILDKYTYAYDNKINKIGIEKYRRGLEEESGRYEYSYDVLSRLTGVVKDGNQLKTFGYDEFGNRNHMTDGNGETHYQYNALNQLISTKDTAGTKQSFSYDKRGNLTQILENGAIKSTYEFNPLNRLTKAVNANGQVANYDYNGLGFRVGKQITDSKQGHDDLNPTKNINYILDQTKQYHNLLQMSDSSGTQSYTWDGNVAFADGNAYLQDELGSPLRYIDNSGETIDSYSYDEFGGDLYGNQCTSQPFGYTGYTADIIAGTYFAQAREYVPSIGRFTGEDFIKGSKSAPVTMNAYLYCWNSPICFVDLNGMEAFIPDLSDNFTEPEDERGLSYIYYDPHLAGSGYEFAKAKAKELAQYHGYDSVNQVRLRPMPNCVDATFISLNRMPDNVDTVIILAHGNDSSFSPHSVFKTDSEGNNTEEWGVMARVTANNLNDLSQDRNVETLILLGCRMGHGFESFASIMASQDFAKRIIASENKVVIYAEGFFPRLRSPYSSNEIWNNYIYNPVSRGFLLFLPDGSITPLGRYFETIVDLLETADKIISRNCPDN